MAQENDLLQQFIDNEIKTRKTTLLFAVLFMIAAGSILYLAYNVVQKKQQITELEINNKEKERIIDSLSKVITRPFEIKDSINNKRTEELIAEVKVRDTLIKQVEKSIDNNAIKTNAAKIQKEIRKVSVTSDVLLKPQTFYTVFIQYNSEGNVEKRQIEKLRQRLVEMGYNVPQEEYRKGKFRKTYVCYFHDEDKNFADEVFSKLHLTYEKSTLMKKDYRAPKKQIEIWINSLPE